MTRLTTLAGYYGAKMKPRSRISLVIALAATVCSCAAGTSSGPPPVSMPAARAGLLPEYRMFYDALQDYGDWVLIEPYGYLFRPRTLFNDWRPYQSGFWAPSDAYGWVWISNEPFGWATYHYGRWAYDDFQGWVWKPGTDWAPAWVDWRANDQYVGWAPLAPGGGTPHVPGGAYMFSPISALGSTDLGSQVRTQAQLGAAVPTTQPVSETVMVDGARVPAGPSVSAIERALGQRLPRARLEDLVAHKSEVGASSSAPPPPTLDELRKAAVTASTQAKSLSEAGGPAPTRVPILRPWVEHGLAKPKPHVPTASDSAKTRPGG